MINTLQIGKEYRFTVVNFDSKVYVNILSILRS